MALPRAFATLGLVLGMSMLALVLGLSFFSLGALVKCAVGPGAQLTPALPALALRATLPRAQRHSHTWRLGSTPPLASPPPPPRRATPAGCRS